MEIIKHTKLVTLIKGQGHRLTSKFQVFNSYNMLYLRNYWTDLAGILAFDFRMAAHDHVRYSDSSL